VSRAKPCSTSVSPLRVTRPVSHAYFFINQACRPERSTMMDVSCKRYSRRHNVAQVKVNSTLLTLPLADPGEIPTTRTAGLFATRASIRAALERFKVGDTLRLQPSTSRANVWLTRTNQTVAPGPVIKECRQLLRSVPGRLEIIER